MQNHFKIFAQGTDFDVEAFLRTTPIQFDYVWHRGEQMRYACVECQYRKSGVEKTLGCGKTIPLHEQQRIAEQFLTDNREALRALCLIPEVSSVILGLQRYIELEDNTVGFGMGLSPELMRLSLDIGITPFFYVTLSRSSSLQERQLPEERREEDS
jgi:hypothetical protein